MMDEKLMTDNFFIENDPFALFDRWFADANKHESEDANAMALASVDEAGLPNIRVVLLKAWDKRGFVFYTNLESKKGVEIIASGKVAVNFHWKSLKRQVRIRGLIERVTKEEADAYFQSRRRISQLGAWASQQSRPLKDRDTLMARVDQLESDYQDKEILRPPHWDGSRILPLEIEFWQDQDFRLHDRLVFKREEGSKSWNILRLYP